MPSSVEMFLKLAIARSRRGDHPVLHLDLKISAGQARTIQYILLARRKPFQ